VHSPDIPPTSHVTNRKPHILPAVTSDILGSTLVQLLHRYSPTSTRTTRTTGLAIHIRCSIRFLTPLSMVHYFPKTPCYGTYCSQYPWYTRKTTLSMVQNTTHTLIPYLCQSPPRTQTFTALKKNLFLVNGLEVTRPQRQA
jgi:hypothetical protein